MALAGARGMQLGLARRHGISGGSVNDAVLYLLVFAAGALVGLSELLTRHRDYPGRAILSVPSLLYLLLNGVLSMLALLVVKLSPPEFLKDGSNLEPVKTVLFVGFGAAAFFRSSFFKLRTPDGDISVGPGLIIDVFLRVIDDLVDRSLGVKRLEDVSKVMTGVSYSKAAKVLPIYCFAALRRLSPEAQRQVAMQVDALTNAADIEEDTKLVPLGLAIMSLTGLPILTNAVEQLAKTIKSNPPSAAAQLSTASPTPPARSVVAPTSTMPSPDADGATP
jgi:hypothetical protein